MKLKDTACGSVVMMGQRPFVRYPDGSMWEPDGYPRKGTVSGRWGWDMSEYLTTSDLDSEVQVLADGLTQDECVAAAKCDGDKQVLAWARARTTAKQAQAQAVAVAVGAKIKAGGVPPGAAVRDPDSHYYVTVRFPGGQGWRCDGIPKSDTTHGPGWDWLTKMDSGRECEVLAVGLTEAECLKLCAMQTAESVGKRDAIAWFAKRAAAGGASPVAVGSVVKWTDVQPGTLVKRDYSVTLRLREGTGWNLCGGKPYSGDPAWTWDRSTEEDCTVLAVGLTAEECTTVIEMTEDAGKAWAEQRKQGAAAPAAEVAARTTPVVDVKPGTLIEHERHGASTVTMRMRDGLGWQLCGWRPDEGPGVQWTWTTGLVAEGGVCKVLAAGLTTDEEQAVLAMKKDEAVTWAAARANSPTPVARAVKPYAIAWKDAPASALIRHEGNVYYRSATRCWDLSDSAGKIFRQFACYSDGQKHSDGGRALNWQDDSSRCEVLALDVPEAASVADLQRLIDESAALESTPVAVAASRGRAVKPFECAWKDAPANSLSGHDIYVYLRTATKAWDVANNSGRIYRAFARYSDGLPHGSGGHDHSLCDGHRQVTVFALDVPEDATVVEMQRLRDESRALEHKPVAAAAIAAVPYGCAWSEIPDNCIVLRDGYWTMRVGDAAWDLGSGRVIRKFDHYSDGQRARMNKTKDYPQTTRCTVLAVDVSRDATVKQLQALIDGASAPPRGIAAAAPYRCAWVDVPVGAIALCDDGQVAHRSGERGAWFAEKRSTGEITVWRSGLPLCEAWPWIGEHSREVTVIALGVPSDADKATVQAILDGATKAATPAIVNASPAVGEWIEWDSAPVGGLVMVTAKGYMSANCGDVAMRTSTGRWVRDRGRIVAARAWDSKWEPRPSWVDKCLLIGIVAAEAEPRVIEHAVRLAIASELIQDRWTAETGSAPKGIT